MIAARNFSKRAFAVNCIYRARTRELLRNSLLPFSENRLTMLERAPLLIDDAFRARYLRGTDNSEACDYVAAGYTSTGAARELAEQSKLFVNLNAVERETWRKLFQAQSVASIAREECVSRSAIYARIQGQSPRGQGGMIAKNFWVLRWWRLQQQLLNNNHD